MLHLWIIEAGILMSLIFLDNRVRPLTMVYCIHLSVTEIMQQSVVVFHGSLCCCICYILKIHHSLLYYMQVHGVHKKQSQGIFSIILFRTYEML